MFLLIVCVVVLLQIGSVVSLNILVVFPLITKSHFFAFQPLFIGLAEKGHNVTVLGYHPLQEQIPNYNDIVIGNSDFLEEFFKMRRELEFSSVPRSRINIYLSVPTLTVLANYTCRNIFESLSVQEFLKSNNQFDIVITEQFHSECVLAMVKKYSCPIVRVTASTYLPWSYHRFGVPLNPSYMSNVLLLHSEINTFCQRLENTIFTTLVSLFYHKYAVRLENDLVGEYFGDSAKTLHEDIYKDSLLLVNRHFVFPQPHPIVPNVVEVGGIHIGQNKPLKADLEKWITEAKHGVIYFSLGSVIKGQTMPEDKKNAFINAFKRMPQRVIWKWENDTMEGKADNIRIGKWLPQFDILSHPNVKAFISHGGLLGTMEAVHSGTPMVIMPQFGDQHTNAQAMLKAGGGVVLYMSEATEDSIYEALKTVLEPKFQTQMKELSERFRDRPMSPLDTAIYWVEYVARHKGAHFMKTAAVGMPFYQYYLLDVIAFILFVLFIVTYLFYVTLRFLIKKITGSISRKSKTKQKKL